MSALEDRLSIGLISGGMLVLMVSLLPIWRIIQDVPNRAVRKRWIMLMAMTMMFITGYAAYGVGLLCQPGKSFALIVPVIFFFGAMFVLLASLVSFQTVSTLQRMILLEEESITDPLTRAYNRRFIERRLREEFGRALRYQQALSILMIDLDNFKIINDRYGHQAGDETLRAFVRVITETIRAGDIFARYGGDEFLVIAPNTAAPAAFLLAERLRKQIETQSLQIINDLGQPCQISMTCSIGLATFKATMQSVSELLQCADQQLYFAKKSGRNRVCIP